MEDGAPPVAGKGLVSLLKEKNNLVGAEIGVSWAQTSEHLLQNLDINTYFCVDPWEAYAEANSGSIFQEQGEANRHFRVALEKLEPFKDRVVIFWTTSKNAAGRIADETLDFVFIDANHAYRAVMEDLNLWWPKVKQGGLCAGHDWSEFQVRPAVEKFFGRSRKIKFTEHDVWYVIK